MSVSHIQMAFIITCKFVSIISEDVLPKVCYCSILWHTTTMSDALHYALSNEYRRGLTVKSKKLVHVLLLLFSS